MCKFFSLLSDGVGHIYYCNWEVRQKALSGKSNLIPDSHASIALFHQLNEDTCNKWEWNPLLRRLTLDQPNARKDDRVLVRKACMKLPWASIVPALRIKAITNPFTAKNRKRVTERDIQLLRASDGVRDGVWDGVWASVRDSVGASVRDSVGADVWDSVEASVGDSVGDSVGASVWAYVGSFFKLPAWAYRGKKAKKYPFQAAVDLWERGLVASYDGTTWRLHGGEQAKILYECAELKEREPK